MTEIAEVVEDRPVCRTERGESCSSSSCRQIKVNRCEIQSVVVRKGRPVTECERVPRRYCGSVPCQEVREECGYEVVEVVERQPVETCSLQYHQQDLCVDSQEVGQCQLRLRRLCRRTPGRRRRRKKKRRKMRRRKPETPATSRP